MDCQLTEEGDFDLCPASKEECLITLRVNVKEKYRPREIKATAHRLSAQLYEILTLL